MRLAKLLRGHETEEHERDINNKTSIGGYRCLLVAMFDRQRHDRGALAALGLLLAAIVIVATISAWSDHSLNQNVAPPDTEQIDDDAQGDLGEPANSDFQFWDDTFPQWLMAIFSVVATGASIIAVLLLRDTLKATQTANDNAAAGVAEASRTNDLARVAYTNDLRPWISIGPPIVHKIEVSNGHYRIALRINVKNVGKSPAVKVRLHGAFHRLGSNVRGHYSLEQFCKECEADNDTSGRNRVLFPGMDSDFNINTGKDVTGPSGIPSVIGLRFLLCVSYSSIVTEEPRHIGIAGTAITQPPRLLGTATLTIQSSEIEVVTRDEYVSLN